MVSVKSEIVIGRPLFDVASSASRDKQGFKAFEIHS